MNGNYGTSDVYEASFITLTTGVEPTIQPSVGLIELRFKDCADVVDATQKYHGGAACDAKQFSRIVAKNFSIIRACTRGGAR